MNSHVAPGQRLLTLHGSVALSPFRVDMLVADGLECFNTKHSTSMVEHYLELADKQKLLVTGGSDCHGTSKGQPLIATVRVPLEHVERLKTRAAAHKAEILVDR